MSIDLDRRLDDLESHARRCLAGEAASVTIAPAVLLALVDVARQQRKDQQAAQTALRQRDAAREALRRVARQRQYMRLKFSLLERDLDDTRYRARKLYTVLERVTAERDALRTALEGGRGAQITIDPAALPLVARLSE
jgi:hypothetical protein